MFFVQYIIDCKPIFVTFIDTLTTGWLLGSTGSAEPCLREAVGLRSLDTSHGGQPALPGEVGAAQHPQPGIQR